MFFVSGNREMASETMYCRKSMVHLRPRYALLMAKDCTNTVTRMSTPEAEVDVIGPGRPGKTEENVVGGGANPAPMKDDDPDAGAAAGGCIGIICCMADAANPNPDVKALTPPLLVGVSTIMECAADSIAAAPIRAYVRVADAVKL